MISGGQGGGIDTRGNILVMKFLSMCGRVNSANSGLLEKVIVRKVEKCGKPEITQKGEQLESLKWQVDL